MASGVEEAVVKWMAHLCFGGHTLLCSGVEEAMVKWTARLWFGGGHTQLCSC